MEALYSLYRNAGIEFLKGHAPKPKLSGRMIRRNPMQYISHYSSPLGNILLAADETGLTGLWFEGQKYLPSILIRCIRKKKTACTETDKTMRWICIFPGKNRISQYHFILQERIFKMKCGKFSVQFPMERP